MIKLENCDSEKNIMSDSGQQRNMLVIRYDGVNKIIPLDEILYIESQNHKVILHKKEENLEFYARIGDLERELKERFFRIHKGYLINLIHVDRYSRMEVTLVNNDRLPISKYRYTDFVNAYLQFMEQREGQKLNYSNAKIKGGIL